MGAQNRKVFERLYRGATSPEDLPWHRDEPPALLTTVLDARPATGAALDIGCGAGTYSLHMARRGYRVTGVDFMPEAIQILARKATEAGLDINAVQADITTWKPPHPFDVVLDVGCLHSLGAERHTIYRNQLLRLLAPGGDFVLVHCGSRGWWDWWPIGPDRIPRETIVSLFAPELELRTCQPELMRGMPLFMGRSALVDRYWFHRKQ